MRTFEILGMCKPYYFKDCSNRKKGIGNVHSIQKTTIIGEMAGSIPQISVTLENRLLKYKTSMMEVEGMLKQLPISILFDLVQV